MEKDKKDDSLPVNVPCVDHKRGRKKRKDVVQKKMGPPKGKTPDSLKKYLFQKGVSGNPKGLAVGTTHIAAKLRNFGKWKAPQVFVEKVKKLFPMVNKIPLTIDDATWLGVWIAAMSGEQWAVNFIADRLEGRPKVQVGIIDGEIPNDYGKGVGGLVGALPVTREAVVDTAEKYLYEAIKSGQSWAIKFSLETIGRDRGYSGEAKPEDRRGQILTALDMLLNNGETTKVIPPVEDGKKDG